MDPHQRQTGLMEHLVSTTTHSASPSPPLSQPLYHANDSEHQSDPTEEISNLVDSLVDYVASSSFSGDSQQLSGSTMGSDATAQVQCVLSQMLDAVLSGWLPPSCLVAITRIVCMYASGSKYDHELLSRASRGKPMQLLLHLYKAYQHDGQVGSDLHVPQGIQPSCCRACHLVVSSMLLFCSQEPVLFKSEAFTPKQGKKRASCQNMPSHSPSNHSPSSSLSSSSSCNMVLVATPLLRGLIQAAQMVLKHRQPCSLPDLAWDGSIKTYIKGWAPADPCPWIPGSTCDLDDNTTLLEKWIRLLGAAALTSKVAAQELYRCLVLDLLEEALELSHDGSGSLQRAIEEAYGACAKQSKVCVCVCVCMICLIIQ
jgi:hypothetical protein